MKEELDYIFRALSSYKDDSLERAELAFRGMDDAALDQQHGQSGCTRRQILEGYRARRKEHELAVQWLRLKSERP